MSPLNQRGRLRCLKLRLIEEINPQENPEKNREVTCTHVLLCDYQSMACIRPGDFLLLLASAVW